MQTSTIIALLCTASLGRVAGQTVTTVAPMFLMPDVSTTTTGGISSHIISGTPATLGQLPWQASIYTSKATGTFFCGGSLINPSWILTAAHCTLGGTSFAVRLGSLSSSTSASAAITSTVAYTHVSYSTSNLNNDIGLIKLPTPVTLTANIKVIQILPKTASCAGILRSLTISGWGKTADNATSISGPLMFTTVTEISNLQCFSTFGPAVIAPTTLCALGAPTQSTCSGDSGGPVVIAATGTSPAYQLGVASFVSGNGCSVGAPSGYTRATPYLDWIQTITGLAL